MSNSTLFKGLGDQGSNQGSLDGNTKQQLKCFPAAVLDICLDSDSPLYSSPRDIGRIRFRDLVNENLKSEDQLGKTALPLDRSIARYPLPGEEVIIYRAFGETAGGSAVIANIFFYSFVVSTMHNISYNSYPFLGSSTVSLKKEDPNVDEGTAAQRFDKKLKSPDSLKDGSSPIIYKQLTPFEGDFILQGRYGNTIRFGSTSANEKAPWSKAGVNGSAIMVLRVDRDSATREGEMMTVEDINVDDASIYLCTSQNIDLNLGCSKSLKSWKARYNLPSGNNTTNGDASNVKRGEDSSELFQKVIDTDLPADQAFVVPPSDL